MHSPAAFNAFVVEIFARVTHSRVSLKNKLVLIADDSVELLKLTSILIRPEGAKVITAKSGNEAVAQALKKSPDLILMDINMPDLDGLAPHPGAPMKPFKFLLIVFISDPEFY